MGIVCRYTANVTFTNRKPFTVFSPVMNVPRATTVHETEAIAKAEAQRQVDTFFRKHFPDGAEVPRVTEVVLGHMVFVPDDYEWRRQ